MQALVRIKNHWHRIWDHTKWSWWLYHLVKIIWVAFFQSGDYEKHPKNQNCSGKVHMTHIGRYYPKTLQKKIWPPDPPWFLRYRTLKVLYRQKTGFWTQILNALSSFPDPTLFTNLVQDLLKIIPGPLNFPYPQKTWFRLFSNPSSTGFFVKTQNS